MKTLKFTLYFLLTLSCVLSTADAQVLIKDLDIIVDEPAQYTTSNDFIFFTADVVGSGHELWRTKGNEASTVLVADIYAGQFGPGVEHDSDPLNLTDVGGTLFFSAYLLAL